VMAAPVVVSICLLWFQKASRFCQDGRALGAPGGESAWVAWCFDALGLVYC